MRSNLKLWNSFARDWNKNNSWKVKHSAKQGDYLAAMEKDLLSQFRNWEMIRHAYIRFAETEATEQMLEQAVQIAYGEIDNEASKNATTRRTNLITEIKQIFEGVTCAATSGRTLWTVFQAMTEQVDFGGIQRKDSTTESRHISAVMGAGMRQKERIFNAVASLVPA